MRRLLKKIPITFWTLAIIAFCAYLVFSESISPDTTELDTLSKILTILGIYFLAIQVKKQTRTSQVSNEYLNQSNFKFNGFCVENMEGANPCLCSEHSEINYNECSDIHWFNYTQIGKLPAKDVKVILIHEDEIKDISGLINERKTESEMVYFGDEHQFKLAPHAIPLKFFNTRKNGGFYILIEYSSVYTKIKYKRIYSLGYSPTIRPEDTPKTWVKSIRYFNLKLEHIADSESITWKEIMKNFWHKILIRVGVKKDLDIHEWLIDL